MRTKPLELTQSEKEKIVWGGGWGVGWGEAEPTDLWDNDKRPHIHILRVLEERRVGLGQKEYLKKNG